MSDDKAKKDIKSPSFAKNVARYGKEFTEKTSLHGVKYLGESKRSIFEKIWWIFVIAVSMFICIVLIFNTYLKWINSPVIVSVTQNPTPIWKIPFPAITVCPDTKSRQSVFSFAEYYHRFLEDPTNITDEELKQFGQIALVCDSHLYNDGDETVEADTIDFLSKVAPQLEEVFWQCQWRRQNKTCDQLFAPIITEEGVCYTFNMLDRNDIFTNEVFGNKNYPNHDIDRNGWTLEAGYDKSEGIDTFPRRALSAGRSSSMIALMRGFEFDLDYMCKGPVQGFKIFLHHPFEMPKTSSHYVQLPINQDVVIAVTPEMMTTSENVINYDPKIRNCYFSSERDLRFFKNYTQQNCEVECLANYTLHLCGCVAYHMPREESTSICGPANIACMEEAKEMLAEQEFSEKIAALNDYNLNCDCLPACTSLTYRTETSLSNFDWRSLTRAFKGDPDEFRGIFMSRMTILYKENQFTTSKRNELYNLTDFLASCGGLLALFIGFSILSAVEIFYFLTLRLFFNIRRYGVHYWSGKIDLPNNNVSIDNKIC